MRRPIPSRSPISEANGPLSETSELAPPDADEVQRLREQHYNATIIERIDSHEDLARFRIRPDGPIPALSRGSTSRWAGLLGTPTEGDSAGGCAVEAEPQGRPPSVFDLLPHAGRPPEGNLAPVDAIDYLEFYVTLVRRGATAGASRRR
jgi:ferredoxin/flavodoxin---NADP+ reductase